MSSFIGKFRNNTAIGTSSTVHLSTKKDHHHAPPTPLEKMLADAGPVRDDGSDKFFGMENFGNTCYCNSILQCLYYSVPFREQVINYPQRSPLETLKCTADGLPELSLPTTPDVSNAQVNNETSATKPKVNGSNGNSQAVKPPNSVQKPEDKESSEYKKKQALIKGPVLPMNYNNAASYGMTESLFTALKDIFEAVVANKSRTGVISPVKFMEVLRRSNEVFSPNMHQDAHEFLNWLLNEVVANVEQGAKNWEPEVTNVPSEDEEIPQSSGSSGTTRTRTSGSRSPTNTRWIHELFEGILTSETRCLTCENVSQRDEVFLDLSVDLDEHSSVTSCLRKFSEEEMLCERNKFHCDKCGGLQEAEKRMKIKRLPRILALHLKRFKYTEDFGKLQKLHHRVVYPFHLRLFNTTDDAEDPDRLYELYAVVVHIGGGAYHGHYVSVIKTQDRGWLLFDDEMVEPVDKNYVRNFFGEKPGQACAYVLFYQETTLEAVQRENESECSSSQVSSEVSSNGVGQGLSHVNGFLPDGSRHSHDITTPISEEANPLNNLNHIATVPASSAPNVSQHSRPLIMPSMTSPVIPTLTSRKSELQVRRDRNREEKERKAAEKEREKHEKAAEKEKKKQEKDEEREKQKQAEKERKEKSARVREQHKAQVEMMKAAIEASKHTKAEEDKMRSDDNTSPISPRVFSGSLNRFRSNRKSMSRKPKISNFKERDEEPQPDKDPEKEKVPATREKEKKGSKIPTRVPKPEVNHIDTVPLEKQPFRRHSLVERTEKIWSSRLWNSKEKDNQLAQANGAGSHWDMVTSGSEAEDYKASLPHSHAQEREKERHDRLISWKSIKFRASKDSNFRESKENETDHEPDKRKAKKEKQKGAQDSAEKSDNEHNPHHHHDEHKHHQRTRSERLTERRTNIVDGQALEQNGFPAPPPIPSDPKERKDKDKRRHSLNRFSLRKKSFGVLNV